MTELLSNDMVEFDPRILENIVPLKQANVDLNFD